MLQQVRNPMRDNPRFSAPRPSQNQQLPVDMLDGLYWRADFTLVPGRVIHDYLGAKT